MMFDTAILSPWHGVLLLCVFVVTNILLTRFLHAKPSRFLVPNTTGSLYYAGWVLVVCVTVASFFFLHSWSLSVGLLGASVIIFTIGSLDEKHPISVRRQVLWQSAIALWVVVFGWGIPYVSNPLHGGVVFLNEPLLYGVATIGGAVAFFWILLCMNAINFLDGTDGFAVSVVAIACIALIGVSLLPATQDATTLSLALILLGALAGLFFWNAPPAKVYLGTTGSWFLGLMIALLAIIGGGKIVTTLIVLALPILDAVFVIAHRAYSGERIWKGDTSRHLHHRLRNAGIGKWNSIVIVSVSTGILGGIGITVSTAMKIIMFILFAGIFFMGSAYMMRTKKV